MTTISLVMEDRPDGSVATKFVSTRALPNDVSQYTPAELFAAELKNQLEKLDELNETNAGGNVT